MAWGYPGCFIFSVLPVLCVLFEHCLCQLKFAHAVSTPRTASGLGGTNRAALAEIPNKQSIPGSRSTPYKLSFLGWGPVPFGNSLIAAEDASTDL